MVISEMTSSDEKVFVGGAVNSLIQLCKGLVADHNQVTIVAGTSQCGYDILSTSDFSWAKIYPIKIKSPRSSAKYGAEFVVKSVFQIMRCHEESRFDIIHSHSGYPPYAMISMITRRLLKLPAIHTLYCPIVDKIDGSYKTPILNARVAKELLKHLEKLIVISRNVGASVGKLGIPPDKVAFVPPAIDVSVFNPSCSGLQTRKELGVKEDEVLILFVGNLTKNKGIDVLIQAIANVAKQYNSAKLMITLELKHRGFDERWAEIESKAKKLDIFDNIIRLGIIGNMSNVMAASDMLIAPWLSTAGPSDYPIAILEAMAIERPVIGTNIGGIPEIIDHGRTGILVSPNDVDMLSEQILVLLKERDLREQIARNASKFVLNSFSIEKVARMTEKVYEEVCQL